MQIEIGKDSITTLENTIKLIQNELQYRKTLCSHKKIKYKHGCSTGNYSPADDRYWVDVVCLDCGASFNFDSEEEGYNLKGMGTDLAVTDEEYTVLNKFGKI